MDQLVADQEDRGPSESAITPVDAEERQHGLTIGHSNPVSVSWIRAEQIRGMRNFQLNSRQKAINSQMLKAKKRLILKQNRLNHKKRKSNMRKSRLKNLKGERNAMTKNLVSLSTSENASEDRDTDTFDDIVQSRLRPLTWMARQSSPLDDMLPTPSDGAISVSCKRLFAENVGWNAER